MKKDISKSKDKKVVNTMTKLKSKLKLKKGMGLNICIVIFILIFIVLFGFITFGVVKYFNNKIDNKNKKIIEEYKDKNICFENECFYILDYSIKQRSVYLISEKNISLDENSIQKDDVSWLKREDKNKYLDYYKKTIKNLGVKVLDISIPTKKQLEKNGCSFDSNTSNVYTCSSEKKWIYSTSYYYEGDVSGVMVNIDGLDSHFIFPFDMSSDELDEMYGKGKVSNIGLRVVLKVPISEVD